MDGCKFCKQMFEHAPDCHVTIQNQIVQVTWERDEALLKAKSWEYAARTSSGAFDHVEQQFLLSAERKDKPLRRKKVKVRS